MFKNLLMQCADLLNRTDIIQNLKTHTSIDEIEEQSVQNDILRLITFYNYIISSIFDKYLELTTTEKITTDKRGTIYFSMLSKTPTKITKVNNNNNSVIYMTYPNCITTNYINEEILVTYEYLPEELKDFSDTLFTKDRKIINTIIYGIVSEFLASKNLYSESDFWKNKFTYNLFELKNNKNKFIKPTFVLWNKENTILFFQISTNNFQPKLLLMNWFHKFITT